MFRVGWVRLTPQGVLGARILGTGGWGKLEGKHGAFTQDLSDCIANGIVTLPLAGQQTVLFTERYLIS